MSDSPARVLARLIPRLQAFLDAGGQLGNYTDEQVRDVVGVLIRAADGLEAIVDDNGDKLTIGVGDASALRAALELGAAALLGTASVAEYRSAANGKVLTADAVWSAAQPIQLVDQPTIAVDLGARLNGFVTLGGDRTLANPIGGKPGQSGYIELIQDGTGNRKVDFGTAWRNTSSIALSTSPGARDCLYFVVKAADRIEVTGLTKGIG